MKVALAVMTLSFVASAAPAQFEASERLQATLQSIEVPAGERLVLKADASGVQTYRCDGKHWAFTAPEAKLYAKGIQVATHGAGPVWRHTDGSAVFGEVIATAPSPKTDSIPLLLLRAARTENNGVFSRVNFIQRMETNGGISPSAGCDANQTGAEVRVNYSAAYLFYAAQ